MFTACVNNENPVTLYQAHCAFKKTWAHPFRVRLCFGFSTAQTCHCSLALNE